MIVSMDWTIVLTALITGALTLGGVWLTTRANAQSEKREATREKIRIQREDARSEVEQADRLRERTREIGEQIANLFLDELDAVRAHDEALGDGSFEGWFGERWKKTGNTAFRRYIGSVTDVEDRLRLTHILDAVDDAEEIGGWNWRSYKDQLERTLFLGFDLASTMARGQDADLEFSERYAAFQTDIDGLDSYREAQREAQREAARTKSADG